MNKEKVHSPSQQVNIITDDEDNDMSFQGQGYVTRRKKPRKLKPTTHVILDDIPNTKMYEAPIKYIHSIIRKVHPGIHL